MEREEMAEAIDVIAVEIGRTTGVSEPDIFRRCIYGDLARLAHRDLPRLSASLKGESPEDASLVLRDVAGSVEANRSTFAWVAPTLSPEAQSIMKPGGGELVGAAMSVVAREAGFVRDDILAPKVDLQAQAMLAQVQRAAVGGRGF